uniref:Chromo domain-containing protein n=1 Tax=Strongyloides stercoralis TaxID=6248 RepID=A0A0K0EMB4_STRER
MKKTSKKSVNGNIIARKDGENGILYKVKWGKPSLKKFSWEPAENLNEKLIKEYENKISIGVPSVQGSCDRNGNIKEDKRTPEELTIEGVKDICKEFGNWLCKVEYSNGSTGWVHPDDISDTYMLRKYFNKKNTINDVSTTNLTTKRGSSFKNQPRAKRTKNEVIHCEPIVKRKVNEETRYVIEKIVDHRTVDGIRQYRIRWDGYTSDDDTWQTSDTFDDINFVKHYDDMVARKEREPDVTDGEWARRIVKELWEEQFVEFSDSDSTDVDDTDANCQC